MIITANAEININNDINISDLSSIDYEIKVNNNNVGIISSNKENGVILESELGDIKFKLNLTTEDEINNLDWNNINFKFLADYNIDKNTNIGINYKSDIEFKKYQILSGIINSSIDSNNIKFNLNSENIIYGYKNVDDTRIDIFGNKIKPSIVLLDSNNSNIKIGYIFDQCEEIDEFGNKEKIDVNKIALDLDFKL